MHQECSFIFAVAIHARCWRSRWMARYVRKLFFWNTLNRRLLADSVVASVLRCWGYHVLREWFLSAKAPSPHPRFLKRAQPGGWDLPGIKRKSTAVLFMKRQSIWVAWWPHMLDVESGGSLKGWCGRGCESDFCHLFFLLCEAWVQRMSKPILEINILRTLTVRHADSYIYLVVWPLHAHWALFLRCRRNLHVIIRKFDYFGWTLLKTSTAEGIIRALRAWVVRGKKKEELVFALFLCNLFEGAEWLRR